MKIRIYRNTILPIILLTILLISDVISNQINILRYSDEVVAIFFFFYIVFRVIATRKINLTKNELKILICSIFAFILGMLGTLKYKVQTNYFPIIIDIIACFKLLVCSLGFSMMLNKEKAKNIVNFFRIPAKLFLIIGFFYGCLSLFFDLGMRGQERFGIWGFNFIYRTAHVYSMTIIFCIIIVAGSSINSKGLWKYIFFAIVQMILTTKGPSIIWAVSLVFIIYFMKRRQKINIGLFILLGILIIFLGQFQIQNYLRDNTSPRFTLYKYGIVTANTYLPLGSGFATYGSDMAAKYYSNLYNSYGFNRRYGMNIYDTSFLNDNYWPMIMGQFGWLGLILFIYIFYNFFYIIQNIKMKGFYKALVFSAFFYTLLHSIGSSTYLTSVTIILFMGIILLLKKEKEIDEEKEIASVKR